MNYANLLKQNDNISSKNLNAFHWNSIIMKQGLQKLKIDSDERVLLKLKLKSPLSPWSKNLSSDSSYSSDSETSSLKKKESAAHTNKEMKEIMQILWMKTVH